MFFLAGAEFLGAMQLMLYVGGTLVLLVFGVMLTARSNFIRMKTGGGEWILALFVGGGLLLLLLRTAFTMDSWRQAADARSCRWRTARHDDRDRAGVVGRASGRRQRILVAVRDCLDAFAGGADRGGLPGEDQAAGGQGTDGYEDREIGR